MLISVVSLPVSLLLVLLRTHCQVAMEVNTDMKDALRGGYTCCVPRCYSNTKRDKELSFPKFPRDVSLGENWVNFIPGEQHSVCSQKFYSAQKKARSDVPQSKQWKPPKIHLPLKPPAKRKKIGTGKSKVLADAVGEEVFFYVDLSVPMRKKELTWS